jgi:hypothetical protein
MAASADCWAAKSFSVIILWYSAAVHVPSAIMLMREAIVCHEANASSAKRIEAVFRCLLMARSASFR